MLPPSSEKIAKYTRLRSANVPEMDFLLQY